ncbi:hypothetical protein IOV90_004225 [Salmonella enterica]|nr:hypothetical protein [Salmonella enterica]
MLPLALIDILGGIIWFQGTIITSRLSEMDSYSQQQPEPQKKPTRYYGPSM